MPSRYEGTSVQWERRYGSIYFRSECAVTYVRISVSSNPVSLFNSFLFRPLDNDSYLGSAAPGLPQFHHVGCIFQFLLIDRPTFCLVRHVPMILNALFYLYFSSCLRPDCRSMADWRRVGASGYRTCRARWKGTNARFTTTICSRRFPSAKPQAPSPKRPPFRLFAFPDLDFAHFLVVSFGFSPLGPFSRWSDSPDPVSARGRLATRPFYLFCSIRFSHPP